MAECTLRRIANLARDTGDSLITPSQRRTSDGETPRPHIGKWRLSHTARELRRKGSPRHTGHTGEPGHRPRLRDVPMNEAKYPTEPGIRQSAKPSDLDRIDAPRIGADRLHQQHIGEPRIDDFAADNIALDLVIHQPKDRRHRSRCSRGSRDEQEIRQHVEQEVHISGVERDGSPDRDCLVTPKTRNIAAGAVEALAVERRYLRIAGDSICRAPQQADIPCAHQLGRPRRQRYPAGSPQQRHKLEPVERWKCQSPSSCCLQPGAAAHPRAKNVEDIR